MEHGPSSYFMSLIVSTSELPGGWPLSTTFSLKNYSYSPGFIAVSSTRGMYVLQAL